MARSVARAGLIRPAACRVSLAVEWRDGPGLVAVAGLPQGTPQTVVLQAVRSGPCSGSRFPACPRPLAAQKGRREKLSTPSTSPGRGTRARTDSGVGVGLAEIYGRREAPQGQPLAVLDSGHPVAESVPALGCDVEHRPTAHLAPVPLDPCRDVLGQIEGEEGFADIAVTEDNTHGGRVQPVLDDV